MKARKDVHRSALLLIIGGLSGCSPSSPVHTGPQAPNSPAAGLVHLFNGRNLDGW